MKRKILFSTLLAATAATTLTASSLQQKAKEAGLKAIPDSKSALYKLIDNPKNPITDAKVALGKMLYFDPRLSKSQLISCNTCHNLATGGVDGVPAATGHKWRHNPHHLNSPTVYNAVFASRQFWDGRSPDLEDQAQGPMQAAPEMAAAKSYVASVVNSIPEYLSAFQKAYHDPKMHPTFKDIADVIGIFERTLVTPSRYDAFLNGDENALTEEEQAGLKTFIDKGCASCHNGYALGGGMQPFPVAKPFPYANVGDFKGNKEGLVKVPTLRNIVETAPYFHNGTVWHLDEAIKIMGQTQLGVELSDKEVHAIETFLKALTGKKPQITYPVLPARRTSTPAPNLD